MPRRLYAALVCALLLTRNASAEDAKPSVKDLTAKARESMVVVSQIGRDGVDRGLGSGFIISEDGLIATCNHVVGQSRELTIKLANGKKFPATAVHAWDRKLDLAILRIDPGETKLQPLALGDSDQLAEGQRIVTIGNPHGLSFSVVEGVVSAVRKIEPEGPPMIQVAIPIEPGNSGGPLIDFEGKAMGVVSMKSTVTDNIGFASPINSLKPLIEKPNTVPMKNWVTIGALDPERWKATMGARGRQRAGKITVDTPGKGFGGRSICLSQSKLPEVPYEIEVEVRLDDESGAAGLAFESDGGDVHYGFYPSSGQIRLTRFDGPDVYSWSILKQVSTQAYRPSEWNHLRIRVTKDSIIGFVNGEQVLDIEEKQLRAGGKAGLAKFRQTRVEFRDFHIGKDLTPPKPDPKLLASLSKQLDDLNPNKTTVGDLSKHAGTVRELLATRREKMIAELADLDRLSDAVHRADVEKEMLEVLSKEQEDEIDLLRAALLVSKLDNPELDLDTYNSSVDRLVTGARKAIEATEDEPEKLRQLSAFLFKQNGFHSSRGAYYSRSNSYLNEVIDDREGIPITLAVLYIELADRLGISGVRGLGLPGHFVVRHDTKNEAGEISQQIIDVFDGGAFITEQEAAEIAGLFPALGENVGDYQLSSKRQIIIRMLTNLKGIAIEEQQSDQALRYVDLLLAINPADSSEHLSRALLLAQSKNPKDAIPDLEWIFETEPEGIDIDRLREFYDQIKAQ